MADESTAEAFSREFNAMQAKASAEAFSKDFNEMQAKLNAEPDKKDDKPKPKPTPTYSSPVNSPSGPSASANTIAPEVDDNEGPPIALIVGAAAVSLVLGTVAYFVLR